MGVPQDSIIDPIFVILYVYLDNETHANCLNKKYTDSGFVKKKKKARKIRYTLSSRIATTLRMNFFI